MRKTLVAAAAIGSVVAAITVGFVLYARKLDARAEKAEEIASSAASKSRLFCDAARREDLYNLWSWMSEQHRRGHPPGAGLAPLQMSNTARHLAAELCGSDPAFDRQMAYVTFLIERGSWYSAARRLYELEHGEDLAKLEIVMPTNTVADALLLGEHQMPNFALSAWTRWHPTGGDDSHAQAFTAIESAAGAWQIALANRLDLFAKGTDGTAIVRGITEQLAAIGLNVPPPANGVPALDWAWAAPYGEFERLAREAELMDPNDDKQPLVVRLREEPYDYRRFRDLLARVRPHPTAAVK